MNINFTHFDPNATLHGETEQGVVYQITPHSVIHQLYVVESSYDGLKEPQIGKLHSDSLEQSGSLLFQFGNGFLSTGRFRQTTLVGKSGWWYQVF